MSEYIKREDAERAIEEDFRHACHPYEWMGLEDALDDLSRVPSADVVEVGIITCLGIKFVVEDDIIKVKWRHGDKHYIVPFGGLLELWEKYKEQEHDANTTEPDN